MVKTRRQKKKTYDKFMSNVITFNATAPEVF